MPTLRLDPMDFLHAPKVHAHIARLLHLQACSQESPSFFEGCGWTSHLEIVNIDD